MMNKEDLLKIVNSMFVIEHNGNIMLFKDNIPIGSIVVANDPRIIINVSKDMVDALLLLEENSDDLIGAKEETLKALEKLRKKVRYRDERIAKSLRKNL